MCLASWLPIYSSHLLKQSILAYIDGGLATPLPPHNQRHGPIYYYSGGIGDCQAGMVVVINALSDGSGSF